MATIANDQTTHMDSSLTGSNQSMKRTQESVMTATPTSDDSPNSASKIRRLNAPNDMDDHDASNEQSIKSLMVREYQRKMEPHMSKYLKIGPSPEGFGLGLLLRKPDAAEKTPEGTKGMLKAKVPFALIVRPFFPTWILPEVDLACELVFDRNHQYLRHLYLLQDFDLAFFWDLKGHIDNTYL